MHSLLKIKEKSLGAISKMLIILALCVTLYLVACSPRPSGEPKPFAVEHPQWVYPVTIYEVNVRQFTPEGTFEAFAKHLPRLQELGVDILWFMPIYPIGEINRKGTLGSYYSVKDYKAVNPEFGTLDDFKALVAQAHKLGMKVIIDWVANHSSRDNVWTQTNPDFYMRDSTGNLVYQYDWTDVAKLNYDNPKLREAMIDALKFWVKEADIDGFRCDVAFLVPTDFWNEATHQLRKIKPVFMLAEAEHIELLEYAFNAEYGWKFHHMMNEMAKQKLTVEDFDRYFLDTLATYPKNAIKMHFTSNHDENSWNGTEFERMGDAAKTFAALSFVIPGMPLIYNGQEVGFNRRLEFFDKDQIDWNDQGGFENFYKELISLKKNNTALWAAEKGADMERILTPGSPSIYAFVRRNDKDKVLAIFNFSSNPVLFNLTSDITAGSYNDVLTKEQFTFSGNDPITLQPWGFLILQPVK